ncbi:NYN domain-containing protein [Arthrobacter sp. JSM 101049]|uniref:NYN domain-containing protein n=1 Tax=Arthrobacter sp. JSM 101049 TaxID=929097 RepID=UPI0035669232
MTDLTLCENRRLRRAAIFVDFDNVYSGLDALDSQAAANFATDPGRWTSAIAGDDSSRGARRFLIRNCYLNPSKYSKYRAYWTRAGYRVIDCPSLTQQGKSSTDINLVLDAVDVLSGSSNVEEYFIASADADFTSLIQRFRARDRQSTVILAGPASGAYRNMADEVIEADDLVAILNKQELLIALPGGTTSSVDTALPPSSSVVGNTAGGDAEIGSPSPAAAAVLKFIKTAPGPVKGAQVADHARAADPKISADWEGYGSLKAWLGQLGPRVAWNNTPPSWVLDTQRFTADDVPALVDSRPALEQQVTRVTDIPRLSTEQFRQLFISLEHRLQGETGNRNEIAKQVRDDCSDAGSTVGRSAVNYVIQGLLYAGASLKSGTSAADLGTAWANNVEALCVGARMEFSEKEKAELRTWASGGLAS